MLWNVEGGGGRVSLKIKNEFAYKVSEYLNAKFTYFTRN